MSDPKRVFRQAKAALSQTLPELLNLAFEAGGECKDLWNAGGSDPASPLANALAAAINAAQDCAGERDPEKIKAALRLSLAALEKEYDETPEDEEYDDLVDRIRAVLGVVPESKAHQLAAHLLDGTDDVDDALNDILGPDPQKQLDQTLKQAYSKRKDVPMTTLGDMLDNIPPMIVDQIMEIVNSPVDDSGFTRQIKPLLNRFQADLEAAGIVPDYLAYALLYARKHLRGQL